MAETHENLEQNAVCSIDEHLPESDDGFQPPESPGTQKLQRLATTRLEVDEPVVSAKLMERPVISGSTGFRHYSYGAAPKRDLHIAKKQAAALYGTPKPKLNPEHKGNKPTTEGIAFIQAKSGSPPIQSSEGHSSHGRQAEGPSCAVYLESNQPMQDIIDPELEPREAPASKRPSVSEASMRMTAGLGFDLAPLPKSHFNTMKIAPVVQVDRDKDRAPGQGGKVDILNHGDASVAPPSLAENAVVSVDKKQTTPAQEDPPIVDLTTNNSQSGQSDVRGIPKVDRTTQVGSPRNSGHLVSSEPGWRSPCISLRSSTERALPGAKSVLRPLKPMKVVKTSPVPQKQPPSVHPGNPEPSAGRSPSEEDLYYLLLHRLRQREQTDKRLAARQRQLESENSKLSGEVQEYERQLSSSLASSSKQAAEIRAQTAVIHDIRNSYSKIKDFMKRLHEDREILVTKTASIDQERRILRDEHKQIQYTIVEAKNATTSSANALDKLKTDISEFRQKTAFLETSLHDVKLRLRSEQNLLAQERCKNVRYGNHIAEITRKQNNFSFTIQQEQQHVLNALKGIRKQLSNLETPHVIPAEPTTLPALDQCVEMLQALTKIETAGPADVTDMIQVVHGLTESINSFQKQSEEFLQRTANSRAQSDSNLLSQVTELFNKLVHERENQDHIAELREAKTTLEERVRGNDNMLLEIRNGKASAEKREDDLRSGNDRLVEELTKLRDTALTTKKGSGPMAELQSLVMKWTSTNSSLAESLQRIEGKDRKLQGQEEHIQSLSEKLVQARAGQQKAEEETQRLSGRLAESAETASRGKVQLLAEQELRITSLQEELKRNEDICRSQSKKIEEVNSAHQTLAKEHDEARSRLSQVVQDCATAKSNIGSKNQELAQMDRLREEARRVPNLVHECEVKDGAILDLQQEIESLRISNQQMDHHRVDADHKAKEIFELKTRLQNAEEASQQVVVVQSELERYKEEIGVLKDAHERVTSLETELGEKEDRIGQLTVKLAELEIPLSQLSDLRMQLSRYQSDLESKEKKLNATKEDAAQKAVLEIELRSKEDEISMLSANLADAERISRAVPEMQTQMDQFSETFTNLKRELGEAHEAAEQLKSTKAANATLQQTIAELRDHAAISEQASESAKCQDQAIQQKDAQIIALQTELASLDVGSQRQNEVRDGFSGNSINDKLPLKTSTLVEDSFVPQEKAGYDNDLSMVDDEGANVFDKKIEPRRKRTPANRSASTVQARDSTVDREALVRKTSECTSSRPTALGEATTDDTDGGHATSEQHLDETEFVPESQPHAFRHDMSLPANKTGSEWTGNVISSSPLSDVGELFDPSDEDHSRGPRQYVNPKCGETLDKTAMKDDIEAVAQPPEREGPILNEILRGHDSPHRGCNLNKANHEQGPPPSSSYGEPLLLDDLEGFGSLPLSSLTDVASGKMLASSSQDVLTSPVGPKPRKLFGKSFEVSTVNLRSTSDTKPIGLIQNCQHLAKDPSPRRLRSGEAASQTDPRPPVKDLGDDNMDARPATPNVPLKEKHQPNSAIKRKSEAASVLEDAKPRGKKRVKHNLSNLEVGHRPGTGSQSLQSSPPSRVGQTSSRPRQSSNSTTSSKSTIVGRNVPAPSAPKERPKKPRGGSKNQRYNERFGSQRG